MMIPSAMAAVKTVSPSCYFLGLSPFEVLVIFSITFSLLSPVSFFYDPFSGIICLVGSFGFVVGSPGLVGSTTGGLTGSTTGGVTGSTTGGVTGSTTGGVGGLISNYLSLTVKPKAGYFLEFTGTDAVKVMKILLFSAVY
jgi:hypothetical protein